MPKTIPVKKVSFREMEIFERRNPDVSSMKVAGYLSDSIPPEEEERIAKIKRKIVHRK